MEAEDELTKRVRAHIGLGANVGDARTTLVRAVAALGALPDVRRRGVSALYRTRPVGVTDQPEFLNAVAALDVPRGPDPETGALALLAALKGLEVALGRQTRGRWGPREVDLDLLVFGSHRIRTERADSRRLEVPHPEMGARLFVLAPLADLAAGLVPPGWRVTVGRAARERAAVEGSDAVVLAGTWDPDAAQWR
ncbi:2-amino-4-hydroxy-6-hydroxymethyldihydropteridinediphosphokinase [soil metagenome]